MTITYKEARDLLFALQQFFDQNRALFEQATQQTPTPTTAPPPTTPGQAPRIVYHLPPNSGNNGYLIGWLKNQLKGEQEKGHLAWSSSEDAKETVITVEFIKTEDRAKVDLWVKWVKKRATA